MAGGPANILKGNLEYQLRFDRAHRSETLDGILPDKAVDPSNFLIGQPGIGLGKGYQVFVIPYGKRIVSLQPRAASFAALGID